MISGLTPLIFARDVFPTKMEGLRPILNAKNFMIRCDFRANAPPLYSGRFFYEDGRATPYSERKEFLGKGIKANAHHLCSGRLVVEIRNRFYTLSSTRRQTCGMAIAVKGVNNLLLQHFGRCACEASFFPEKACAAPAL